MPYMSIEQRLAELSDGVTEALKSEGLYMERAVIAKGSPDGRLLEDLPDSPEEMLDELIAGEPYLFVAHLRVGDRAFHPRVENPEQYKVDKEARKIIPTEADLIREQIERGEDPFSLDDEEDEDGTDGTS